MKIDGGCHCGSVRFEAEVEPTHTALPTVKKHEAEPVFN